MKSQTLFIIVYEINTTKRAYIDIYASKTPIFNNYEDCLALVEKYNESMTDIEKDSDMPTA